MLRDILRFNASAHDHLNRRTGSAFRSGSCSRPAVTAHRSSITTCCRWRPRSGRAGQRHPAVSGGNVPALLPESRVVAGQQPADLHRRGRRAAVRRAHRRDARRRAREYAGAGDTARRRGCDGGDRCSRSRAFRRGRARVPCADQPAAARGCQQGRARRARRRALPAQRRGASYRYGVAAPAARGRRGTTWAVGRGARAANRPCA